MTFPEPIVDTAEIVSGGPPPDGIPSIDEPTFLPTADVDLLAESEPVLAIDIDGDTRAYPIQVMIWHEIVEAIEHVDTFWFAWAAFAPDTVVVP